MSCITDNNKQFDGNTTATLIFSGAALVGVIAPDVVTLATSGATGTFSSPAVGTWTVTIAAGKRRDEILDSGAQKSIADRDGMFVFVDPSPPPFEPRRR